VTAYDIALAVFVLASAENYAQVCRANRDRALRRARAAAARVISASITSGRVGRDGCADCRQSSAGRKLDCATIAQIWEIRTVL